MSVTKTDTIVLKIVNVLFWIAFVGLCIKTGSLLFSFIVSLMINSVAASNLYMGLDLSDLFGQRGYYILTTSLLITLTGLKAYIAYLIVGFFIKFDLEKPFQPELAERFTRISHASLQTGVVALVAEGFSKQAMKRGTVIPIDWSGNEILFFAGVIYLIALVYKKGIELQTENDLTV